MVEFLTVADEVVEHAEAACGHFESYGFAVAVEKTELAFPYTPTLVAARGHEQWIVEVQAGASMERITTWVRFAKSCSKDTRVILVMPQDVGLAPKDENALKDLGVGVFISTGNGVYERLAPRDQALGVELPDIRQLPPKVRGLLGSAYEKFERGEWREGFADACQILETQARRHLKNGISRKRVRLVTPGGKASKISSSSLDRFTLGQLADAYGRIASPNHAESIVEQALVRINADRVGVTHHKQKAQTEARLRRNVGQHMFVVINALKVLA